jgi:preprotein translocase subunit YajC
MFESVAYALGAPGGAAPQGGSSPFGGLFMMLVIFAIFYLILIRPQQKKMKEHKKMVEELKKGDHIVTSGGIIAMVESVSPEKLTIKIAEGVKIKITRSSVAHVLSAEEAAKE